MTPTVRKMLTWGLSAYAAWLVLLWLGQRQLMFPAQAREPAPEAAERAGAEVWWLDTEDGRVEGWFLPGRGVTIERPGPALVYFHGNGELVEDVPTRVAHYQQLGFSVLVPEYRGYGGSAGSPSEDAIIADALAFYDRLAGHAMVDSARIAVHGRSLGSGPATQLAAARPVPALILTSPFTSMRAFASGYLAPGFLVRDPFDNEAALERVSAPVLILHGDRDGVVPYAHGAQLAERFASTLVTFEGAGHNDLPYTSARHAEAVQGLLTKAGLLGAAAN